MKIEKVEKYGVEVYSNIEMDKLRKEECLCFNCLELGSCRKAVTLKCFCEDTNIAMMITRCPDWRKL